MIAEVKRLIEAADPSVLLMSRRNCHAAGVDSFVLMKEGRCLTRFFAAWPGHPLGANFPGSAAYSVGPHNHRYGLTLSPIGGKVVNYEYESHPDGPHEFTRYAVTPRINNPGAEWIEQGKTPLICVAACVLKSPLWLPRSAVHTVYVPGDRAAWLVEETQPLPSGASTTLYANAPVSTDGFYLPFDTAEQVRARALHFLDTL